MTRAGELGILRRLGLRCAWDVQICSPCRMYYSWHYITKMPSPQTRLAGITGLPSTNHLMVSAPIGRCYHSSENKAMILRIPQAIAGLPCGNGQSAWNIALSVARIARHLECHPF